MVPPVHAPNQSGQRPPAFTPDSRQAWMRLVIALLIGSIGGVGMWAVVVVIPVVQTEFAATRGAVSLAFTLMMFGFGLGGVMAGASHWFERYRGLAVTIVASGNYVAGTIWPPLINLGMERIGWRYTHVGIALVCVSLMTILVLVLRAQIGDDKVHDHANAPPPRVDLKLSTNTLTELLSIASISCCVAMAMPQVHIVAYCGDLGYGVA